MDKIKIAIIEDILEIANSLKELIGNCDDMVCNFVYSNAEDAMNFIPHNDLDIVVADIGLPRASGIDAIRFLTERCPKLQFCIFTVYDDDDKIFQSLQAGAKAYILKNSSNEKIIESVRELHHGGSPMSPSIARRIIDIFRKANIMPAITVLPLTRREIELLDLLSMGYLYKEIADKMGITTGTVKQHIHKIYDKLQVSNRTEAINKYRLY
jgi:DNA-binding NarL/FixJ family response regulator